MDIPTARYLFYSLFRGANSWDTGPRSVLPSSPQFLATSTLLRYGHLTLVTILRIFVSQFIIATPHQHSRKPPHGRPPPTSQRAKTPIPTSQHEQKPPETTWICPVRHGLSSARCFPRSAVLFLQRSLHGVHMISRILRKALHVFSP